MRTTLDPSRGAMSRDVDLLTGGYVYQPAADLIDGAGAFPYSLPFLRTYRSDSFTNLPLGAGWSHNYDIFASADTSLPELFGETSPARAALTLVSLKASIDASAESDPMLWTLQSHLVAAWWYSARHNTVTIANGHGGGQFVMLANGSYEPHPSSPQSLLVSKPGNNQGYDLTTGTGDELSFSFIEPALNEVRTFVSPEDRRIFYIDNWEFSSGIVLSFDYRVETATLSRVSNSLGRYILFEYPTDLSRCVGVNWGGLSAEASRCNRRFAEWNELEAIESADGFRVEFNISTTSRYGNASVGSEGSKLNILESVQYGDTGFSANAPSVKYTYDRALLSEVYDLHDSVSPVLTISHDYQAGFVAPRASAITTADGKQWRYYTTSSVSRVAEPNNAMTETVFDRAGRKVQFTTAVGDKTRYKYDGVGRKIREHLPEGQLYETMFDARGNVLSQTHYPHDGVGDYDLSAGIQTMAATYLSSCSPTTNAACNKPLSVEDADGNVTIYNYYTTSALLHREVLPSVGGASPTTTYTYNSFGQLLTVTDPENRTTSYQYYAVNPTTPNANTNGELRRMIVDPGGLGLTTQYSYDWAENVISVTDPKLGVWTGLYDDRRRIVQQTSPDPDGAGSANPEVMVAKYDIRGLLNYRASQTDQGNWLASVIKYDAVGRAIKQADPRRASLNSNSLVSLTIQAADELAVTEYDPTGRVRFTADPEGRATKTVYYQDGQIATVKDGWTYSPNGSINTADFSETSLARDYQTMTYTENGKIETIANARGNITTYTYDGYDRPKRVTYPDGSYTEAEIYDARGNVLQSRTRAGQVHTFTYDALSRVTRKATPERVETYRYDQSGLRVCAELWPASSAALSCGTGSPIYRQLTSYDGAGRLVSETAQQGGVNLTTGYQYDPSGNRTAIIWPDNWAAQYEYDALNRLIRVRDNSSAVLAKYTYDRLNRPTETIMGGETYTSGAGRSRTIYAWEDDGDMASLTHEFAAAANASFNFGYDRSGKLISESAPSDWLWTPASTSVHNYAPANVLDQYGTVDGQTLTHDLNGNRTSYAGLSTPHDSENRLIDAAVASGINATYAYDTDGRRVSKTVNGTSTRFAHAGDMEIAEYNGATLLRRYIPGPGVDQRVAMIESGGAKHYYHANRTGSVQAMATAGGALADQYLYTPFGIEEPFTASGNPFRYTGRRVDPETGLYYYRARYYDPELGRFLQTDPIGYDDQMNLYAYVANDPMNATDPDGRELRYTFNNGATVWDGVKTMGYLAMSPTARGEISQLAASDRTYTINFDGGVSADGYDFDTRTVTTNPTGGMTVLSSGEVMSPAMVTGHEITHGAEHDRLMDSMGDAAGTTAFFDSLAAPMEYVGTLPDGRGATYRIGISPEEARATSVETQIGNELGEATRQNYLDVGPDVTTCGPTSTSLC